MNNYLKPLFLLVLIATTIGATAQLNYKKGYVITNANDTLYGNIDDAGGTRNAKFCLFKQSKKSKAVKYTASEIKAYRFIDDKYYVSKKLVIKNKLQYVFVDVLIDGKLNLYRYRKTKDSPFYIEKKDSDMIPLMYKEVTTLQKSKHIDSRFYYQKKYNIMYSLYKDTLYYLFKNSEKILRKLEDVEYDQKSLTKITQEYLKETCSGNNCIKYVRDWNWYKPTMGVFSGVRFNNANISELNIQADAFTSIPVGLFFNFPMQTINDKLSFQIEIISNIANYKFKEVDDKTEISSNTIGIPLLFKYEILKGKISPFISVGKEIAFVYESSINNSDKYIFSTIQKGGWLGEIGVKYKLTPKLSLFSNIRNQSSENEISEKGIAQTVKNKKSIKIKTNYTTFSFGLQF